MTKWGGVPPLISKILNSERLDFFDNFWYNYYRKG